MSRQSRTASAASIEVVLNWTRCSNGRTADVDAELIGLGFTSANGDTLTAAFTGTAQQGPVVSIVEIAVITGGTGRFAGATGAFTVWRQFVQSAGITTGSFEGTISRPGE